MEEQIKLEENSVESTMLGPLWARAKFSQKNPELLNDKAAIEIIENIKYDLTEIKEQLKGFRGLGLMVRAKSFDKAIDNYISNYPNASIINLGCGLDTNFYRIDNGTIKWYNIDLPNVIEIRERLIPNPDRCKNIAKSILDFSWLEEIEFNPKEGIFIFAGGLLYYFKEEEVKTLFKKLAGKYTGGEFIFDSLNNLGVKVLNKKAKKANVDLRVHFAIDKPYEYFENLSKRINVIDSYILWSRTPFNSEWSFKAKFMILVSKWFKIARIIQLQFI